MKNKIRTLLWTVLLTAIAGGATGCREDNLEPDNGGDGAVSIEISETDIYATSATFTMQLSGVSSYAYEIEEGPASDDLPLGEIIFSNAQQEGGNGVFDAVDGQNTLSVYGLEGSTEYTVYLAFRTGSSIEVRPHTFTTPEYTDMISMIEADWFSIKFHIEVPEDMYWKWGIMSSDMYYQMKTFGASDVDFFLMGSYPVYSGPQTIELESGEAMYGDLGGDPISITPGTAYYLILFECDENGEIDYEVTGSGGGIGGLMSVAPDLGEYTTDYPDDWITCNSDYARLQFWTRQPDQTEHKVTAEQVNLTARRAVYRFTPADESVRQYGIGVLSQAEYDQLVQWVGEKGVITYILNYLATPYTSTQELEWEFSEGVENYKLFVIATYNENSTLQSSEVIDVQPLQSDLPPVELKVEHVETPDDAFTIQFKVTAPNKDAAGIRYVMNYTSEWESILRPEYGMDEAYVLDTYGVDITDAEVLSEINSDAGYIMSFTTAEMTESMLAVAAYNSDEVLSDVETATGTSAEDWGDVEPGQESPLLAGLAGDWTATYTHSGRSTSTEPEEATFKVTLATGPEAGPESFGSGDEGYQGLMDYWTGLDRTEEEAAALIADYFSEYKELAEHYADKYASHNRLVACGFDPAQEYKSSWDLFLDTDYVSYTTDELFNDYGPKFFIEVDSDGNLATMTNSERVAPLSAWYYYEYYMFGYSRDASNYANPDSFPTELSADNNTVTINPYVYNGTSYYPSVGYYMSGSYASFVTIGASPVVLTRGWDESASASSYAVTVPAAKKTGAYKGNHRFMKTRLPSAEHVKVIPRETYEPVTLDDIAARYNDMAEHLKK